MLPPPLRKSSLFPTKNDDRLPRVITPSFFTPVEKIHGSSGLMGAMHASVLSDRCTNVRLSLPPHRDATPLLDRGKEKRRRRRRQKKNERLCRRHDDDDDDGRTEHHRKSSAPQNGTQTAAMTTSSFHVSGRVPRRSVRPP